MNLTPETKQPVVATVKQYVVGKKSEGADFDFMEIEELILNLAKWFGSPECGRSYPEPLLVARKKVEECLLGEKEDGTAWGNCPNDFRKRIKIKCNYDIKAKRGIPVKKHVRKLDPKAQEGAKELKNIRVLENSLNMEDLKAGYIRDILNVFPELDNPAHIPNVESLADVYVQRKVISAELMLGTNVTRRSTLLEQMKVIESMADSMMNKLGIHPNQIRKKVSEDGALASVPDLVAHISEDKDFQARELAWARQFALQLWWMSEHHNYLRDGRQLSDFEIWHLTRTRPFRHKCDCGREVVLVEGFEPHELRDWLVKEGVLVEEPVVPGLISETDLKGLSTFAPEQEERFDGQTQS